MKEDLRHRLWMVALSLLGSFLTLPVLFLLCQRRYLYDYLSYMSAEDPAYYERYALLIQNFFMSDAIGFEGIILTIGALIVGIAGFRYLYSRRMTDTYHAIPVKRTTLFLAYYLNGLLIWLIPFAFNLLCALLLAFASLGTPQYFGMLAVAVLKNFVVCLLAFLMAYHLCLFSVMLCGNAINAIISSIISGTAVFGIYAIINALSDFLLPGFLEFPFPSTYISWTSPFVNLAVLLNEVNDWLPGQRTVQAGLPASVVGSVILMIFHFLAAWRLYLHRPSELCESGIRNKWWQLILRTVSGLLAGLLAALVFIVVFGTEHILGWCIFGAVLCSVLAFGIMDIIFRMDFRAFFRNWPQMLITAGASVLTVLIISLDLTGFEMRIPDKDQIAGTTVFTSSYSENSYLTFDENGYASYLYSNCTNQDMDYQDADKVYELISALRHNSKEKDYIDTIYVKIKLKNGGTFLRTYKICKKDTDLLRPILESEEYRNTYYSISAGNAPLPSSLNVGDSLQGITRTISDSEDIQKIMAAYQTDFLENWSIENLGNMPYTATLRLYFLLENGETSRLASRLPISVNYVNTLAVLKELNMNIISSPDELEVNSITLSAGLESFLPEEALYSSFGVEGYPDYDEVVSKYTDSGTQYMESASYITNYELSITDPAEIAELLPILYIGDSDYSPLAEYHYRYVGTIRTPHGSYGCYAKDGTFPEEWVKKLLSTGVRNEY